MESGAVSLTLVNQDGSKSTKKGSYQEGKITIGETSYFLSKGKKGSVRIIQEEDSEFTVDLQKIGSPPPSVVSPPHDEKRSDNQPAPRWAVGFFRGSNRKYNLTVDLVIFADGSAVAETIDSVKKKNRVTGGYRGNGILRLGPNDYYLEQMDNSIITTQKRDRTNQVAFQRQANGPTALAPSRNGAGVPEWLVGTFRGKANKYHFAMELTLQEDGSATVQTTDTEGKKNKVVGTYKNGVLRFGRFDYDVQRAEKGFRTTQTNDPDNFVDYHR